MIPVQVYLMKRRFSLKTPEWSLIFFTVLIQFAVGAILFLGTVFGFSITKLESAIPKDALIKFLLFITLIIIIALLSSFLHLGKPKNSIHSITHFASSWLSREIVFVLLFTISLCLFSFVTYKFHTLLMIKQVLLIAVCLFAIVTLYSMIKVYVLPTVPAWNSISTPIRFFSTAIILGGISFIVFAVFLNKDAGFVFPFDLQRLVKIIFLIIAAAATINLAAYLVHLIGLKSAGLAELESYKLVFESNLIPFYLWIGLSVISIILLFYFGVTNNLLTSLPLSIVLAVGLSVVELISRHLFYAYYARVGI